MNIQVEICIDSVEGALAAQQGGAHRVELCANLLEGGTTPSAGMIAQVRQATTLGLMVMIRPRGGDFCYSDAEFAVMQADIEVAKRLGADGVVLGLLTPDGTVDAVRTAQLVTLARPLAVTFHRAIDVSCDPVAALEPLMALGVERVLTSGQAANALTGAALIAPLVRQAGARICIMAGGGVNEQNAQTLIEQTGVREIHLSARQTVESLMRYRNPHVAMGATTLPGEYTRLATDVETVKRVVQSVRSPHITQGGIGASLPSG